VILAVGRLDALIARLIEAQDLGAGSRGLDREPDG
jgi:hypothetical protein